MSNVFTLTAAYEDALPIIAWWQALYGSSQHHLLACGCLPACMHAAHHQPTFFVACNTLKERDDMARKAGIASMSICHIFVTLRMLGRRRQGEGGCV